MFMHLSIVCPTHPTWGIGGANMGGGGLSFRSLPEMPRPHRAVDIHVCIVQALVIANYKLTRSHEYDYFFHNKQK